MKKFLQSNINGVIFWIFIATIIGFLSKLNFLTDICCHFRIQYLLIAITALILYFLFKIKDKAFVIAITAIIIVNVLEIAHCFFISPSFTTKIPAEKLIRENKIKVGLINLLTANTKYEAVADDIEANNPDILILEEIDYKWSEELYNVTKKYRYRYEYLRDDNFGMAIYSNIRVKNFNTITAGDFNELPVLTADVEINGKDAEIIAIHTTPPTSNAYFKNTKKMLYDLSEYIKHKNVPLIVAGDMNSTRFSYNYKIFIKQTKMQDACGLFQRTWPSYWTAPLRIPLDHVFFSKHFGKLNFYTGKNVGSDHFPVYSEFYLQ